MRALALVMVAIALAGCARPAMLGGPPAHECFFGGAEATWTQASLYDELPAAAERAGLEVMGRRDEPRVTTGHPTLAAWKDPSIVMLSRTVDDGSQRMRLIASLQGEWRLESSVTWDNETLARHAVSFLDAIGLGAHPERAAWLHSLNTTRGQGAYPYAHVVADVDIAMILDGLGEGNATLGRFGHDTIDWARWSLSIQPGMRAIEQREPFRFDLMVDERGNARAMTTLQDHENATEVFHARAALFYERVGLELRDFGPIRGGYGGC